MGTKNNHPLIVKVASIVFNIASVSATPEVSIVNPKIIKTIKVTMMVGTVVSIMYFICENNSPPAMAGAKFVVSLNGDSLSPK